MKLNDGQYKIYKEALKWFRSSSEQVFEIDGPAGVGKSVLMHAILRGLNLRSDQYMSMAYTGQAAIIMRTKGFKDSRSIHSSLYEVIEYIDHDDISTKFGTPKKKRIFRKKQFIDPHVRLFFIDEAYMVPGFMVRDILSFGVKVIVCGDSNQLPPIGDKPAFLCNPNRCHHLTELMRQSKDNPIIYLANRVLNNEPIHCGMYGNSVMVANVSDFFPEMLGYADTIITATNKSRDIFNNFVRDYLGFYTIFPNYGERLICRNNNWDLQIDGIALANGLCGYCTYPPDMLTTTRDTFRIGFKPDIINAAFDTLDVNIKYFTSDYGTRREFKNNGGYKVEGELFEYAYALTTHLSQGAEYDKGIILNEFLRPQLQKQLEYTAITRFKKSIIILKKDIKYLDFNRFLAK